ncbi:MAG: asparagine synthase (glutamine-hydrolyzing), partial [Thermoleophilia bacterium]|nr:asparagine synthase (glutamine-hydrolyzing) [Thermoleophilia bacterium]
CVLGHRRLAILDLSSAGHQPMSTPDGRYWITYNGEVYNYVEIAAELERLGHRFATRCDTEVLLRAYAHWGRECLPRLNGMFAFAIWDARERRLLCARDRLGVKPFYYAVRDRRFRFASEPKALLVDGSLPRRPNEARVRELLAFGLADHTEETLFEGLLQLPPGTWLEVGDGRVGRPRVWWRPQPAREDADLGALLADAVRLRLRSDVPVGTCLSGGLDSSSVVVLASALRRAAGADPPLSFTARCLDPALDEGGYVEAVVRRSSARNHTVVPSAADALAWTDWVVWQMDEPFHAASVVGQAKVMELARAHGVTVLLDGQGGDEAFAGYHDLYPAFFWTLARRGRLGAVAAELAARERLHGVGVPASLLQVAKLLAPARLRGRTVPTWLRPERRPARRPLPGRSLGAQQRFGLAVSPLPAYLHHEDRNSMSFSLEARVPLLDYRVVELALRTPPERLIRDGYAKWALREALRAELPEEVAGRASKQGFTVEDAAWLRDGLGSRLVAELGSPDALVAEYLDGARLVAAVERAAEGGGGADALWRAFTLERWLRVYVEPERLRPPPAPSALARRAAAGGIRAAAD